MNKKRYAAVSCINEEIINALEKYSLIPVQVEPYKGLNENPESTHADMQILTVNNTVVLLKNNTSFNSRVLPLLSDRKVVYTDNEIVSFKYPECVKLNVLIAGHNAIADFKHADGAVKRLLDEYNLINVKQGYAKCCTAVVDDNSVITADESIYKAAVMNNINCLKITPGHIDLCERYYGFIGGCSFKPDNNTIVFTGDIDTHPDSESIISFCTERNVKVESLTNKPLFDVGGVIII